MRYTCDELVVIDGSKWNKMELEGKPKSNKFQWKTAKVAKLLDNIKIQNTDSNPFFSAISIFHYKIFTKQQIFLILFLFLLARCHVDFRFQFFERFKYLIKFWYLPKDHNSHLCIIFSQSGNNVFWRNQFQCTYLG